MLRALERETAERILPVERPPADAEVRGLDAAGRELDRLVRGLLRRARGSWYQCVSRCASSAADSSADVSCPSCSSAGVAPAARRFMRPRTRRRELAGIAVAHRGRRDARAPRSASQPPTPRIEVHQDHRALRLALLRRTGRSCAPTGRASDRRARSGAPTARTGRQGRAAARGSTSSSRRCRPRAACRSSETAVTAQSRISASR